MPALRAPGKAASRYLSTDHACTGNVYEGGQSHHLLSLRADIFEAGHLQGHQAPRTKITLGLTCDDFTLSLGPLEAEIHLFSDGLSEND